MPDIGDFEDVPIIEILVSPGDTVAVDDPLLTLESDKATMDVPAPFAGTISELHVKVGDRVSQGTLLLTIEAPSGATATAPAAVEGVGGRRGGAPSEAAGAATRVDRRALRGASAPLEPQHRPGRAGADGQRGPIYASPSVAARSPASSASSSTR